MAGNWNFLLEQSRGEYFCLLSDDDFLQPEFSARLVDCYRENPGATFAYSGCEVEDRISRFTFAGYPAREPGVELVAAVLSGARTLFLCSLLLPTELLRHCGGFPKMRFSADFGAWLPLLLEGDAVHCPEILAHYTAQAGSITANIGIADAMEELDQCVRAYAADPRITPAQRARILALGEKKLASNTCGLLWQRAAMGTPKWKLIRSLPLLRRFLARNAWAAVPAVMGAVLLPARVIRYAKAVARSKRERVA